MHALPLHADGRPRRRIPAVPARAASAAAAVPRSPAREQARRRLVRLVFAIYVLAIVEGALRKYALPQFGQVIFFVRDPLVIWAYALATGAGLWPRRETLLSIVKWVAVAGVMVLLLQLAFGPPSDLRLLLGAYGWRAYFFYAPLAMLIGAQFERDDLLRLARLTLLLAVPIALLVAAQFFSPPGATINVGTAGDRLLQFHDLSIDTAHARPTGPFSSSAGQQQFVATGMAMLMALMIMPAARRRISLLVLLAGGAALMTCVALSGSRGTVLQVALVLLFGLPVALLGRGAGPRTRAALIPLALAFGAVVLYPVLFPEGFAAFTTRWTTAAHEESGVGGIFGRALLGVVDFLRLVDAVPPLGFGLGFGGNAATLMKATIDGAVPNVYAETDYARQMVDLGVAFGVAYIVFRVVFVLWMLGRVLRATRRTGDPLPMMLFAYAGQVVLQGQITGNGTINVYGWLFAGLCLAACRVAGGQAGARVTPARPRAREAAR